MTERRSPTYQPRGRELYRHGLNPGDPFSSSIYPQVLPELIDAQVGQRLAGPIFPDPKLKAIFAKRLPRLQRVEVAVET